jgi:uncharacterized protein (TIGR03000 family)
MRYHPFALTQVAGLVLAALAGSPAWAQGVGYPGGFQGGFGAPYPGAAYYPYWGSAPSSVGLPTYGTAYPYWHATPAVQGAGPIYHPGFGLPHSGALGAGPAGDYYSPSPLLGGDLSLLPGGTYTPAPDNTAHIYLHVPADAEVWFDGEPTRQKGTLRHFNTPPLTPDKKLTYEVRARWTRDGKPTEETRRLHVRANEWLHLDFTRPPVQDSPASAEPAKPAR